MGQIYVEVTGDTANGIMTMDASGGGGGITGGAYWLNWTPEGGFTGCGWHSAWNSSHCTLSAAWSKSPAPGYAASYDGFWSYVSEERPNNLNQWLDGAGWNNTLKWSFLQENTDIFSSCTTPV